MNSQYYNYEELAKAVKKYLLPLEYEQVFTVLSKRPKEPYTIGKPRKILPREYYNMEDIYFAGKNGISIVKEVRQPIAILSGTHYISLQLLENILLKNDNESLIDFAIATTLKNYYLAYNRAEEDNKEGLVDLAKDLVETAKDRLKKKRYKIWYKTSRFYGSFYSASLETDDIKNVDTLGKEITRRFYWVYVSRIDEKNHRLHYNGVVINE